MEEVDRIIEEELAALAADHPPTADEIDRARNNREVEKLYAAESLLGRAELLQSYRMHLGTYNGLSHDLARYRAVTAEGVRAEAAKLSPARRGRLHVLPEVA